MQMAQPCPWNRMSCTWPWRMSSSTAMLSPHCGLVPRCLVGGMGKGGRNCAVRVCVRPPLPGTGRCPGVHCRSPLRAAPARQETGGRQGQRPPPCRWRPQPTSRSDVEQGKEQKRHGCFTSASPVLGPRLTAGVPLLRGCVDGERGACRGPTPDDRAAVVRSGGRYARQCLAHRAGADVVRVHIAATNDTRAERVACGASTVMPSMAARPRGMPPAGACTWASITRVPVSMKAAAAAMPTAPATWGCRPAGGADRRNRHLRR